MILDIRNLLIFCLKLNFDLFSFLIDFLLIDSTILLRELELDFNIHLFDLLPKNIYFFHDFFDFIAEEGLCITSEFDYINQSFMEFFLFILFQRFFIFNGIHSIVNENNLNFAEVIIKASFKFILNLKDKLFLVLFLWILASFYRPLIVGKFGVA